jgi:hypothetical protein
MTSTSNTTKAASVGLPNLDLVPAEGPGPFFCNFVLTSYRSTGYPCPRNQGTTSLPPNRVFRTLPLG